MPITDKIIYIMKLNFKKYRYTCIVCTNYALVQYLLIASQKQIENTCFFICNSNAIDRSITDNLSHVVVLPLDKVVQKKPYFYHLLFTVLYWWIPSSIIFAQDHTLTSSLLIGKGIYTLLEDGPSFMSTWQEMGEIPINASEGKTKRGIPKHLKYGYIYKARGGANKQCINRFISNKKDMYTVFALNRKLEILNMSKMWQDANEWKKIYIYAMYIILIGRNCKIY